MLKKFEFFTRSVRDNEIPPDRDVSIEFKLFLILSVLIYNLKLSDEEYAGI